MKSSSNETYSNQQGPIEQVAWGLFVIVGKEHGYSGGRQMGAGTDIRVIGEEVTAWKEREGHILTMEMITGVFDKEIDVLIIGTGILGSVECPGQVEEGIRRRGIEKVVLEKTPEACRMYNELFRLGRRVALLAHGTC